MDTNNSKFEKEVKKYLEIMRRRERILQFVWDYIIPIVSSSIAATITTILIKKGLL